MIWVVVACRAAHRDRLERCLGSLDHPPTRTVVVTSVHHDPLEAGTINGRLLFDTAQDFSLSRLWNMGLDVAYHHDADHVAVLSSDVAGHPASLAVLATAMTSTGAVMAGPDIHGQGPLVMGADHRRTQYERVPGGCFMLDGTHRLRCDEGYRWWYGDDDLECQAREVGPVALFAGTGLTFTEPDTGLDTEEKERWAGEDHQRFVDRWGRGPW